MSDKILLALQFWKGDQQQAYRLAEYLADLEPEHSKQADFLFCGRFDSPHNLESMKRVSRKFNVRHFTCRRTGVGWPTGCNELWTGTMEFVTQSIRAGKLPKYKAIFTFEADNVPLQKGWINHFSHHWDRELQRRGGQLAMMGFIHPLGPHINGNCLVSLDDKITGPLLKASNRCPPKQGWDVWVAPLAKRLGWAKLPGMACIWRTPTVTDTAAQAFFDHKYVWVHGVKDDTLLNYSRSKLL